jgi:DNA-binding XRE family transcriptional regulator
VESKAKRTQRTSKSAAKKKPRANPGTNSLTRRLDARTVRIRAPAVIAFGLVLQELRQRRRLSRDSVASLVDVESEDIAEIERGTREPTLVLLFKLANVLGVEPSELIARMERKLQ